MSPARYVPYYRVSTVRQGQSGLGLEAQRVAVHAFAPEAGQLLAEFVEVESGKKNQRPQLLAAIAAARQHNATLLIAKLDRLSRNAGFILALRDSGVDFVCCDMPDANTLTVGIFTIVAQHERETISKRTKDALAAKLVLRFQEQDIQFVSLQDHLDTSTAQGRLMFNLFASLAEFERDLIRERTHAGLQAARARGRQGGRPPGLSQEAQSKAEAAKTLYLQKDKSVDEIARLLGIGRSTVYRYLGLLGVTTNPAES